MTAFTLESIRELLLTQDARCTSLPAFCVQVLKRFYPIDTSYADSDKIVFYDSCESETYFPDGPDPERFEELQALDDEGKLPDEIERHGYTEAWVTVQTCLTEKGAEAHLEANGHNYSRNRNHCFGTRIYVDSLYRNPEMVAIRQAILDGQFNQTP